MNRNVPRPDSPSVDGGGTPIVSQKKPRDASSMTGSQQDRSPSAPFRGQDDVPYDEEYNVSFYLLLSPTGAMV